MYDKCDFGKGQTEEACNGKRENNAGWVAFLKKKKALINLELDDVIKLLKSLLVPIVENINKGKQYAATWHHKLKTWREDDTRNQE